MICFYPERKFDLTMTSYNPLQRLVAAMTGTSDPAVVSLVHNIMDSKAGIGKSEITNDEQSKLWRKIQRRSSPETASEVQALYKALEEQFVDRPDIPPKLLDVLSNFVGQNTTMPSSSSPFPANHLEVQSRSMMFSSDNDTANSFAHSQASSSYQIPLSRYHSLSVPTNGSNERKMTGPDESSVTGVPEQTPTQSTSSRHHTLTPTIEQREKTTTREYSIDPTVIPTQPSGSEIHHDEEEEIDESEWMQEEDILMRECLYSLQGIDGERIRYFRRDLHSTNDIHGGLDFYEGIRVRSPAVSNRLLYAGRVQATRLGSGAMDALRICGEAGWFYTRIHAYIHDVQQDETKGVVARAFAEALSEQLHEYQSLLSTFEAKLPAWSLRQLLVELRQPTRRLKLLAMLADGLKQYKGGHLLAGLHKHTLNGNTAHASLVRNILIKASRPWFEILFLWTTQGILSDPWNELFISESPDADDRYLWSDKYIINRSQVPNGILDKELVGPAFNVGKGINFIRRCLQDGQWTMPRLTDESLPVGRDTVHRPFDLDRGTSRHEEVKTKVLGYGYTPKEDMNGDNIALKATLNRSSRLVHSYILRTLKDENHLMLHLYAMKQFLLLGQGDFFSTLMEGLDEEFGQQAAVNTLYSRGIASINKHSLIAIVDGALRSTNAKQLPPFVIERLQVELMLGPDDVQNGPSWVWNSVPEQIRDNDQPPDERTVYDIFLMDYQVPDPMIAIVPEPSLHMYQRIFKLLFRLKRIEYLLNSTWRQSASLQHSLQLSAQHTGIDVSQSQGYKQASFLLRNISILRQSMMHLVVNLKSFLHFEVIEGGWFRLVAAIDDATTLDEIIEAHNNYINDIARKAMVQGSGHGDPIQQKLVEQVESALVVTTEFCLLQHAVFADALDAADTAAEGRKQAASRIRDGEWGFKSEKEMEEQQRLFGLADPILMEEVDRMTIEFQDGALGLIQALNDKVNGSTAVLFEEDDTGCSRRTQRIGEEEETGPQRFLIAQLDNNNYYTQHARR